MAKQRVIPDIVQQFKRNHFVYMPVLYVDGRLTTIAGVKAHRDQDRAHSVAYDHAERCRKILKKKKG